MGYSDLYKALISWFDLSQNGVFTAVGTIATVVGLGLELARRRRSRTRRILEEGPGADYLSPSIAIQSRTDARRAKAPSVKFDVSWAEVEEALDCLSDQLKADGFVPSTLISLNDGGSPIVTALLRCRYLDFEHVPFVPVEQRFRNGGSIRRAIPLATGPARTTRWVYPALSKALASAARRGHTILVPMDTCETGETLKLIETLAQDLGVSESKLRTFGLVVDPLATKKPDYYGWTHPVGLTTFPWGPASRFGKLGSASSAGTSQ